MTMEIAKRAERPGVPELCREMPAPITEVTITEDQADIRRTVSFTWESGTCTVFIAPVTPYLVDSTLWAEIQCADPRNRPDIGSVRAIRWFSYPESTLQIDEASYIGALEKLWAKIEALEDRCERLSSLRKGLTTGLKPSVESIVNEIVTKGSQPEHYETLIDTMLKTLEALSREQFSIQKRGIEYEQELVKMRREWLLRASETYFAHRQAGILVTIEAATPGEGALRCGYQVPCAQWRPQHEAHLIDEKRLLFTTHGVVWQNTGEDWNDASLTLSTATPSVGMDAILPDEDVLQLREKTKEERRQIRVEARDQAIQTTGAGAPDLAEPPLPADGGETQLYKIPEKVTIASNGRPVLIKIGQQEMEAETALLSTPELDGHVFLISRLKNNQEKPILAGPVTLHRMGTFIGTGQLEFTGSRESFHMWWGSEDLLRVERYVDTKKEEATLVAPRKVTKTITLQVRNLSGEEARFRIQERIPVSELEQVRVKIKKPAENSTPPDSNGFIFIDAAAGPGEEKKYEYSYLMEMDRDVEFAGE